MASFVSKLSTWPTAIKIVERRHFACNGITNFDQGGSPNFMSFYEFKWQEDSQASYKENKTVVMHRFSLVTLGSGCAGFI